MLPLATETPFCASLKYSRPSSKLTGGESGVRVEPPLVVLLYALLQVPALLASEHTRVVS
ncbi:MAG: hypothetical protein M3Y32_07480 [Pseudomonadota bacterium]|nr:hypothetical protein [Pseudomonadota bacterium]